MAPLLERHLGPYADAKTHAFVALNTAFFEDGAFIEIPKGAVLQKPVAHLCRFPMAADGALCRTRAI